VLRNKSMRAGHSLGVEARERTPSHRQDFERLYVEHFDRVAAYLLARADSEAAREALVATFEVAWRRIEEVPRAELPWLLGIARRVIANDRRSRARQIALLERMTAAAHAENSQPDDPDLAADLADALMDLTPLQREALLLIAWDGLSEREAAKALGCSRVAFAARLHRARSQVRVALSHRQPVSTGRQATPLPLRADRSREEPT
jgi:RNA polymerase sigma-70 factor (ECF subfamily)